MAKIFPADIAVIIRALEVRCDGDHYLDQVEVEALQRLASLPSVAALLSEDGS